MQELRCDHNILFGKIDTEEGFLEVRCRSRLCGHVPGEVVVLHRFSLDSGKLLDTVRYADPAFLMRRKDGHHA